MFCTVIPQVMYRFATQDKARVDIKFFVVVVFLFGRLSYVEAMDKAELSNDDDDDDVKMWRMEVEEESTFADLLLCTRVHSSNRPMLEILLRLLQMVTLTQSQRMPKCRKQFHDLLPMCSEPSDWLMQSSFSDPLSTSLTLVHCQSR